MESNIVGLMKDLEILYENIYILMKAYQQIDTQSNESVDVSLKKFDGTTETVTVKSFQYLQNEINRLSANFNNIVNENNISYILNSDGSLTKYLRTTFSNAERIEVTNNGIVFDTDCSADYTSLIADFIYPNVKIPITINSAIKGNVVCRSYIVTEQWSNISDNITYLEFKNMLSAGTVVAESEIQREITPIRTQLSYYGKFVVTNSVLDSTTNYYTLTLDTVKYGGLNVNGNNINLRVDDELVSKTTMCKYRVLEVNTYTNVIKILRTEGITETISVDDVLYFDQVVDNDVFKIGIPVKPQQQMVVFLSTINEGLISYPSNGIKIDTSEYNISYNDTTYTIDEFFTNYVVNLSEYLLTLVDENNIPNSLGIKPATPQLYSDNFKVIQINKHINTGTSIDSINKYNTQKQSIQTKITDKENSIAEINNGLLNGIYTTIVEKNKAQNEIVTLYSDINTLNQQLLVLARKIDDEANTASLKTSNPKYRIAGYWSIQNDLYSSSVGYQSIVKYDVWYRYLNQSVDNIDATTLKMVDGNEEVSVVFSPWIRLETESLQKVKNVSGKFVWESVSNSDVDSININQCLIPISNNESVEIKIRAISEAGYPLNPVKSEWSKVLKVTFPDNLKESDSKKIISNNETELKNSEFISILDKKGLLSHITSQVVENEKVYHHLAQYITSGLYTSEMKHIPLDVAIKTLRSDVDSMMLQNSTLPTISIVDPNGEEYIINNNQELNLLIGSLSDMDLTDSTNYGKIFKKTINIKIENKNQQPIEIRSLRPSSTATTTYESLEDIYKLVPTITSSPLSTSQMFHQDLDQILYFRTVDMSLIENNDITKLYKTQPTPPENSYPISIDNSRMSASTVYGISDQGFVAKVANDYNVEILASKFTGIPTTNDVNALLRYQLSTDITTSPLKEKTQYALKNSTAAYNPLYLNMDTSYSVGFSDIAPYLTGRKSCGALFYPIISKQHFVNIGESLTKHIVLHQNESIKIPLVFEYRPIDAFGNVEGISSTSRSTLVDSNNEYSKTLGVTMLVNNQQFLFDVKCRYKLDKIASQINSTTTTTSSTTTSSTNILNS